jgi:hypothetical protein
MKRNPWPYAILLYFIVFISAMAAWIVFAVRNDQELVRADYYEQELTFQRDLDGSNRGASADFTLTYQPEIQALDIRVPSNASNAAIYFYRPSEAKLDRTVRLQLKDGQSALDLHDFQPGMWKLRVTWNLDGLAYRRDESLVLAPFNPATL